jgi:hypothetical protein
VYGFSLLEIDEHSSTVKFVGVDGAVLDESSIRKYVCSVQGLIEKALASIRRRREENEENCAITVTLNLSWLPKLTTLTNCFH